MIAETSPRTPAPPGPEAAPGSSARRPSRCPELDVLRFLAAAAVVAFHWLFRSSTGTNPLATTGFEHTASAAFRYGYLGVDVFFVISGFVILRSAWGRTTRAFLLNRAGRLYPTFWVACTLTAVAVTLLNDDRFPVTLRQWGANLTMGSEAFGVRYVDGVYWTLLVELAFYGLVAAGTLFGLTVRRVLAGTTAWLAISVVDQFWPLSAGWSRLLVPDWAPYFAAGVGFALLAKEGPGAGLTRRQRWAALALTVAAGAWSLVLAVRFAANLAGKYGLPFSSWVVVGVLLTTFAAFVALTLEARVPGAARIAFLGALTYPLYLVHENIGYALLTLGNARLGLNRWLVLAVVGTVVLGLAWVLHRFVEVPGSRRVGGLVRRLGAHRPAPEPTPAHGPRAWLPVSSRSHELSLTRSVGQEGRHSDPLVFGGEEPSEQLALQPQPGLEVAVEAGVDGRFRRPQRVGRALDEPGGPLDGGGVDVFRRDDFVDQADLQGFGGFDEPARVDKVLGLRRAD